MIQPVASPAGNVAEPDRRCTTPRHKHIGLRGDVENIFNIHPAF